VSAFADALGRTTITYTNSLWTERDTEAQAIRYMVQLYRRLEAERARLPSAAEDLRRLHQKIEGLAVALEAFDVDLEDPLDRGSRWE
jgi:hypothetical protein